MKGIEFILLAIGAVAGAFLRYKMVSSPIILGVLPVNVLVVNVIGSFILGVFSNCFRFLESRYKIFNTGCCRILWFSYYNVFI